MEIKKLQDVITDLIVFWKKQNILICPTSEQKISEFQKNRYFKFPADFLEFYSKVDGMKTLYPNENDHEGFLFYPLDAVISVSNEFGDSALINKDQIFLFADYMHKSWWYGFELISADNYVIGIFSDKNSFKPITNSLADFIEMYMKDSPKLYDYLSS
ncbi:SMI1/KNR4 family protein SUKH-1 [Chryseobacterium sp. 52]|uniref:SMI1/KNR4 family protein n=1 Tax=Chryseobacterium sp. 52 TaxID=2035213 RepID=UPI000C3B7E4A|nr:SMI1/KNR4 family protein [Chryseobacterium sp. 52]PIF43382.1 SMI1/KNR4 family protein SUKH-1 [Chryseobacterium sp. 52]